MKKFFAVFTALTLSTLFYPVSYSMAEQNTVPPLLVQQPAAQPPPPGVLPSAPPAPPAPGTPPGPPVAPPPPGPGIGQAIPEQTLLNNLPTAVTTVQKIGSRLTPGKVWTMRGPAGEVEVKTGILYQGSVVAVLHFNPLDGSVFPLGIHTRTYQNTNQLQAIKTRLTTVINGLKILPVAEFLEPEASWCFPVALGNTIVAHLKVYYDGIHIVPDYPANQEMTYYGQ